MGRGADPTKYYLERQSGRWVARDGTVLSSRAASQIDPKYVDKALQYLGVGK